MTAPPHPLRVAQRTSVADARPLPVLPIPSSLSLNPPPESMADAVVRIQNNRGSKKIRCFQQN